MPLVTASRKAQKLTNYAQQAISLASWRSFQTIFSQLPFPHHLNGPVMTTKCFNFSNSINNTMSNIHHSQQPDNELLPVDRQMSDDKLHPLSLLYGDKKKVQFMHDSMKKHGTRTRRSSKESKRRRRYQRRNSKVASMLFPPVRQMLQDEKRTTTNDYVSTPYQEDPSREMLEPVSDGNETDDSVDLQEAQEEHQHSQPPTKRRRKS